MSDENTSTPEPTPTAVTETLDEHNDNRYGNAWEIVQYSGVTQTFLWGFIIAALSGVTAWFFAPQPAWVAATLLGFTTGFIARIDNKTRLIKNTHTLITLAVTVPASLWVASQLGWMNLLGGVISSAVVIVTFILLIWLVGFGSGGDLKYAPVAAFTLGTINPLIAALWFFEALIITVILLLVRKNKETSFGEGMALAIPLSIISTWGLFTLTHIAYI